MSLLGSWSYKERADTAVCLHPSERERKGVDVGGWGGQRQELEKENHNQHILY